MTSMWHLPRRTFLRGLGTAMALPLLDGMLPGLAFGAPTKPARTKPPVRMGFLYVPNGKHMQDWTPKEEGSEYQLTKLLEPLKHLKHDMLVLTGLTLDKARANGDGGGDHARSLSSFLTACQARKTHGADIKVGTSVDQIAADRVGGDTRFPSLEIGCDRGNTSGNCDSGYSCAYSSSISWRTESSPLGKEVDPRHVFDRLFGTGDAGDMATRAKRDKYKQSILDLVSEDTKSLQARLGVHDQRKLDEYLHAVREIEQRIARAAQAPKEPPQGATRPSGIPKDYAEHIRLLGDLMVLAFQTDTTRVSTFVFANEGSNRSYAHIEVPEGHHDLSHHGNDEKKFEKIKKINTFHVEQLNYIINKMMNTKEAGGTLLDNSMIVYGSGIADGNAHNHDNLPILLFGKGGGTIKTGRHIRYDKETPLANLYLSMLDRFEVKVEKHGDSTGRLKKLDS